jgi:D-alanine-D-alanine ligase
MKRIIAIVAGGDSSEHDVSLRSAEGINSFLDKDKYDVYIVEIKGLVWEAHLADGTKTPVDRNDFSFMDGGKKIVPDFAYITIHGTPGENGILQGYFDLIRMPYSTSSVLVEALTFNKFSSQPLSQGFGVRVSDSILIRKGKDRRLRAMTIFVEKLGLPCFVKPNADGSSFGVTKVKKRGTAPRHRQRHG